MATVSNFSDFRLRSIIETSFYGNNIIRINSLAEAYRLSLFTIFKCEYIL